MKTDELETRLAGIDLFQGMSKRALKQLIGSRRQTEHPDGREVISEGSGAIGFHLITALEARHQRCNPCAGLWASATTSVRSA